MSKQDDRSLAQSNTLYKVFGMYGDINSLILPNLIERELY